MGNKGRGRGWEGLSRRAEEGGWGVGRLGWQRNTLPDSTAGPFPKGAPSGGDRKVTQSLERACRHVELKLQGKLREPLAVDVSFEAGMLEPLDTNSWRRGKVVLVTGSSLTYGC